VAGSITSARWIKFLVASSLMLAAAISVPLAFRERATADFLVQVARYGYNGSSEAKRAALESASSYTTVFWFDLALAAVLILVATSLFVRSGPSTYAAAGLAAGFAVSSSIWARFGGQAELSGTLPVGVLAETLTTVAGLAVLGSIAGWASTAPIGHRMPLSPPVPPSHQAG
jgi:hypothetical protein